MGISAVDLDVLKFLAEAFGELENDLQTAEPKNKDVEEIYLAVKKGILGILERV